MVLTSSLRKNSNDTTTSMPQILLWPNVLNKRDNIAYLSLAS